MLLDKCRMKAFTVRRLQLQLFCILVGCRCIKKLIFINNPVFRHVKINNRTKLQMIISDIEIMYFSGK